MLNALRILVLTATMVAASGVVTAYASCCEDAAQTGCDDCDGATCPPGAVCSLCASGSAVVPAVVPPVSVTVREPRVAPVPAPTWRLIPDPGVTDIFHPPRTAA